MVTLFSADLLSGEQILLSVNFMIRAKSKNNKESVVLLGREYYPCNIFLVAADLYPPVPQPL